MPTMFADCSRFARPALAAALCLAGALPVAAQTTTPGSDVPALVTPGVHIPPFDSLVMPPGGGLPRAPSRGSLPGAPVVPPASATKDGKFWVTLTARFGDAGAPVKSGVQWRVFHDETDQNGNLPLAAESKDAAPSFELNPGGYVVHATYGLATVTRHLLVDRTATEQIPLKAGALRFKGVVAGATIAGDKLRFKLTANDGGVERLVSNDVKTGSVLRLPEGSYHVVSTYGDANSIVEVDVRVQPGRLLDAIVYHKAAEVTLKLVRQPNGDAVANTSWTILTPGGDVVRESIGAFPNLVLTEGNYSAIARNDGQSFSKDFQVKAGQNFELEVLRN
jgi:hypothetical protein